jgi:competence protein ComFA
MNDKNCAVNAVCGAGKTEIIYETIKYCLNNSLKIGIAIPRKDVVIELKERITKDFNVDVIAVYGGNSSIIEGDVIVFTTHQAYRYLGYFDVLIIDEVDAFPYKNNDVLKGILSNCSKIFVYLSATMPRYLINDKNVDKFYLNKRYHGYKIPVPKCVESFNMIYTLKRYLRKYKDKVVLVYLPTIKEQMRISKKVKSDFIVNSKMDDRENVLKKIKQLKKGIVLTTTVLERGITIKDVQVLVYNSDHRLFDTDALIQISGRVGRDKVYNQGNVIFICKIKNKSIKRAIRILKKCNE